jgi:hypothetical protein
VILGKASLTEFANFMADDTERLFVAVARYSALTTRA